MTPEQRALARHALGLPNKKMVSNRNYFCTGEGSTDYPHWEAMVENGDALRRTSSLWGGDNMYYLTRKAALEARESDEHLSREDVAQMLVREVEAKI